MLALQALSQPVEHAAYPSKHVGDLLRDLDKAGITGAPVLDRAGRLAGFVTLTATNLAVLRRGSCNLFTEQVMNDCVMTLPSEADLSLALHVMVDTRSERIVLVGDKNRPEGILDTHTILATLLRLAGQKAPANSSLRRFLGRSVSKLMSLPTNSVLPTQTLAKFLLIADRQGGGGHVVTQADTDIPIGFISQTDVSRLLYSGDVCLYQTPVSRVMSDFVYRCNPDDDLQTALETMVEQNIDQVVVVKNEKLVGFLSTFDVLNSLCRFLESSEQRHLMSA